MLRCRDGAKNPRRNRQILSDFSRLCFAQSNRTFDAVKLLSPFKIKCRFAIRRPLVIKTIWASSSDLHRNTKELVCVSQNVSAESIKKQLCRWHARIRATHQAHYRQAALFEAKNRRFGTFVVILSSVVGTGVFASFGLPNVDWHIKAATAVLSVVAVVSASLQKHFDYAGKRTPHIMAGAQLSALKKRIEGELAAEEDHTELKRFLHQVVNEWNTITETSPLLSEKVFSKEIESQLQVSDFLPGSGPAS